MQLMSLKSFQGLQKCMLNARDCHTMQNKRIPSCDMPSATVITKENVTGDIAPKWDIKKKHSYITKRDTAKAVTIRGYRAPVFPLLNLDRGEYLTIQ